MDFSLIVRIAAAWCQYHPASRHCPTTLEVEREGDVLVIRLAGTSLIMAIGH